MIGIKIGIDYLLARSPSLRTSPPKFQTKDSRRRYAYQLGVLDGEHQRWLAGRLIPFNGRVTKQLSGWDRQWTSAPKAELIAFISSCNFQTFIPKWKAGMTDQAPEPTQEITFQSFAEFLESSPPNQTGNISDLMLHKWAGPRNILCLKTPEIQLHCTDEACNGVRFYRCTVGNDIHLDVNRVQRVFLTYTCSNCQKSKKVFSIVASRDGESFAGTIYKFGEQPIFGPPTPARLLKLIGPDRDIFLKGRRCENQGLGIGAFVYYRRVVENQKNRIFREIIKVLERLNAPKENLELLNTAISETQFSKALEVAKPAIPESLLIDGHNPLKLLYGALSEGIHNMSDEDCLGYASSIRIVLGELSERLAQALKNEAELNHAISRLLTPKATQN